MVTHTHMLDCFIWKKKRDKHGQVLLQKKKYWKPPVEKMRKKMMKNGKKVYYSCCICAEMSRKTAYTTSTNKMQPT